MGSFSKNILITFLTEILVFVLGSFVFIIIARTLGPAGQGMYSLIVLIPGIMLVFGSFGIESANVYFIGSKKYEVEDVVANSLVLSIFFGSILTIVFSGILLLSSFQRFIYLNNINYIYLWAAISTIPFSLLLSFFKNIILGTEDIKTYNKTTILERIFQLILIIVFLLILKKGIFGAIISYVLTIIIATFFATFFVKKISKLRFSLNKNLLKDSFVYGGKAYIANALSFLNYRSDMILIAFFLTPAAVGLFSVAVGISEKLFMLTGPLATVLFPRISSIESVEANDFTPKIVRHTFFIIVICSLLLFFFANPLIKIVLGSDFLPSVLPLMILLPGIIAFGIGGVLAADLAGRGKPQFAAYSSLTCLIVNFFLNIIFIPKWGISGAAFASSVSYWADTLIILIAFLKISKKTLRETLLIKKEDFQDYFRALSNLKDLIQIKK
jgi:O-antigen/teichoic acid export membrane protein